MRREAMNNSSSAVQWAMHPGRADRALPNAARGGKEEGVGRVNANGQTDERPAYSGQILWTLSGPFSWSSLATMLAAGGLQAALRYSTMQNFRQYHHHRVLHAVNTIITDKIGPREPFLPRHPYLFDC